MVLLGEGETKFKMDKRYVYYIKKKNYCQEITAFINY